MSSIPRRYLVPHSVTRRNFKYGVIDTIEDISIPVEAASRSLGWLTKGDKIELVRGRKLIGTEIAGVGRVSGIVVGFKPDGTQVLFRSYGKKVLYYSSAAADWVEISSDVLGSGVVTAADPYGEDITFTSYDNLAGAQVWLSSPNSSLFKIMVANPGSIKDQYDSSKNFKGYIKAKGGRLLLWNRGISGAAAVADKTGLYGSYIDKDEVSDYSFVDNEAIGSAGSSSYAGTLSTVSGKKTCFGVSFTDGTETFVDDKNGVLSGSLGGSGTINYSTGAYSITFAGVAAGSVTADYYTEDSTTNGIADFTKATPRTAGQGFVLRQDDGGGSLMSVLSYNAAYYCLHALKTWLFTLSADDLTATNMVYREKVGTPSHRAPVETGKGVYYIDDTDETQPRVRLLTLDSSLSQVIPVPVSNNIHLADYRFDKASGIEYGDYVLWACRRSSSEVNDRIIALHRIWGSWDILPFFASCFAILDGVLVCGDSLSSNAYELFSGLDDDDSTIENYWEGANDNLQVGGMKACKRIVLEGNIGPNQSVRVYMSLDNSAYVEVGLGAVSDIFPAGEPAIYGQGSYVDRGQRVSVGPQTLGRGEVGGGSSFSEDVEAYHYKREFKINQSRFERVKIKYVAQGIGYASVTLQEWVDFRTKSFKIPNRYRVD